MNRSQGSVRWLRMSMVMAAGLVAAACAKHEAAATAVAPAPALVSLPAGLKPTASVLDLMNLPIDQYANDLWGAVSSVSTAQGMKDIVPTTDDDWKLLRQKALVLQETANMLAVDGRPVAQPGQKMRAEGGAGELSPDQAQAEIAKNPAAFVAFAALFQSANGQVLDAIQARDVDKFQDAGGALQEACEECHKRFWYPNAEQPAAP